MKQVWALRHQTGALYSAVEWTRARLAVRNVIAPAPQLEPASPLKECDACCKLFRKGVEVSMSDLSSITPRYVGSEQMGRVLLLCLNFSSRLASLLLRWKTTNTAIAVLSFNVQVWRYPTTVAMSLVSTPSTLCESPSTCMIARSSSYAHLWRRWLMCQRCRCWREWVPGRIPVRRRSWGVVICFV